ncbi:MAG TPA: XRE family transcriptional regulator [Leptospiraceae bacterium]|nr:XRE family transcriptional regulator [Leptospiraceae bacterium]HMW06815.1 XRE family transcriptional regulator [Leptospiraceae bacterium]HMX32168.1 XRE family transcriptional regulator [Leptospiraceae bacterium]HMY32238.1 XRE family transcriptional regulator [Leptospiraceae bacterium]HMZ63928.1 XRE family transcriptional regulator [Leptospiraceae bacterium]
MKQIEMDGFSESAISRLESRTDFKISTLIDYISQLNLELEITVRTRTPKKKEFVLVKA